MERETLDQVEETVDDELDALEERIRTRISAGFALYDGYCIASSGSGA